MAAQPDISAILAALSGMSQCRDVANALCTNRCDQPLNNKRHLLSRLNHLPPIRSLRLASQLASLLGFQALSLHPLHRNLFLDMGFPHP